MLAIVNYRSDLSANILNIGVLKDSQPSPATDIWAKLYISTSFAKKKGTVFKEKAGLTAAQVLIDRLEKLKRRAPVSHTLLSSQLRFCSDIAIYPDYRLLLCFSFNQNAGRRALKCRVSNISATKKYYSSLRNQRYVRAYLCRPYCLTTCKASCMPLRDGFRVFWWHRRERENHCIWSVWLYYYIIRFFSLVVWTFGLARADSDYHWLDDPSTMHSRNLTVLVNYIHD